MGFLACRYGLRRLAESEPFIGRSVADKRQPARLERADKWGPTGRQRADSGGAEGPVACSHLRYHGAL